MRVDLAEPLAILRSLARQRATSWFPELGTAAVTVDARVLRTRLRSTIVLLHVDGGGVSRQAVAKLRRDAARRPGARPGLAGERLPAAEQSALEYAGLRHIEQVVGAAHPRLRAVRALEHVPSLAGVVMERVDSATGRATLTGASRLRAVRAGSPRGQQARELFRGAGEWLRCFHGTTAQLDVVDRGLGDQALDRLLGELAAYLTERVGPEAGELAGRARALLPAALHDELPRAVGHGDFAVRNTLVDRRGRVAVIDPLPRWRTPVWEDLARFTVSARLQGLQVATHGIAYGAGFLDTLERDFLTAYFGGDVPSPTALSAGQLLVLFDKWSALVSARPPQRGRLLRTRDVAADRYVRREARRLLAQVEAGR